MTPIPIRYCNLYADKLEQTRVAECVTIRFLQREKKKTRRHQRVFVFHQCNCWVVGIEEYVHHRMETEIDQGTQSHSAQIYYCTRLVHTSKFRRTIRRTKKEWTRQRKTQRKQDICTHSILQSKRSKLLQWPISPLRKKNNGTKKKPGSTCSSNVATDIILLIMATQFSQVAM